MNCSPSSTKDEDKRPPTPKGDSWRHCNVPDVFFSLCSSTIAAATNAARTIDTKLQKR